MLGGVAVEPDVLPEALAVIGAASPLGAAVVALRSLLDGAADGPAAAAALLGWGALGTALAARTFRWEA
jgi:hypothetical protein